MRGCVSSRQRFQSNCLANAALRGKRELLSFACSRSLPLSLFLLPSLLLSLSLAHSRSRAPGSRPGRDRFERSRRPSSARPRPDTASASHSLSLSISLKRAGRSSYPPLPLSRAFSLSLRSRRVFIRVYTHTFPLPHNVLPYSPYSLTFGLLRFCRLDRARVPRIIASFSHRTNTTQDERRPRVSTARLSTWAIEGLLPSPTLAHFSRRSPASPVSSPPSPFCRFRGFAVSRVAVTFFRTNSSLEYPTVFRYPLVARHRRDRIRGELQISRTNEWRCARRVTCLWRHACDSSCSSTK